MENAITAGAMQLAVLSSHHFRELQRQGVPLRAVLVGEQNGTCRQTHILWLRADALLDSPERPLALASSRSREEIARFLSHAHEAAPPDFRHLKVPKDIDALLSVAFGMADAALATRAAADDLFKANPTQAARLSAYGAEVVDLYPVVAALDPDHPPTADAIRLLERMGDTPEGRQCLLLLGLDRFRPLDDELRKELAP